MNDFLDELKKYIEEHYTGNEPFEPVPMPMPCVREASICCDYEALEEPIAPSGKKNRVMCGRSCSLSDEFFELSGMRLKKESSLDDLLKKTEDTFSDKLFALIAEKEMDEVEVYKKANLDRRLFSKLRNKGYKPSKNTILALILALKLDMQEARDLLSFAGYNLAPNEKTDIIVSFFLEKQVYDIYTVNEALDSYGEKCLGNSIK